MNTKLFAFVFAAAVLAAAAAAGVAAAAVDAPVIGADLVLGSKGEDVRSLQRFLNASGFAVAASGPGSLGNETATFGSATRAALARYQAVSGIPATGVFDSKTRILLAIQNLRNRINALLQQLSAISQNGNSANNSATDSTGPRIVALKAANGGESERMDFGDSITITFNEPIDPESINSRLDAGGSVSGVPSYEIGGVSASADGIVTIKGVAEFDIGTLKNAGAFTASLRLDSDRKVLKITLSGAIIEIADEDLGQVSQIGGSVKNAKGNVMTALSDAVSATGTFGGAVPNYSATAPYITAIDVHNGGEHGYIDKGDYIEIDFNEPIDPKSVNENLANNVIIANLQQSDIGGLRVTADGRVDINAIAAFDMGAVKNSGSFTAKIALSSSSRVLTITITDGVAIEITDEDFGAAAQIGGAVKDASGTEMQGKSNIITPTGSFGGIGGGPNIVSIEAFDGNSEGYIDRDDYLNITFDKEIDPASVNGELTRGGTVAGVGYSHTGGVAISPSGTVIVRNIAEFDMGSVSRSGNYSTDVSLSADGQVLTVVLASDNSIKIDQENFGQITQIGGAVADEDGKTMSVQYNAGLATGTFGGAY